MSGKSEKFVEYTKPHYSTKIWRSYFHYVQRFYSATMFESIIRDLEMPKEYLLKDGNWVSNSFSQDFMKKLKEYTGDEKIAENVCRFSLAPENINPFEFALIKAMPPFLFFHVFPFELTKVNKLMKLKKIEGGFGKIKYQSIPKHNEEMPESSVCEGIVGTLKGVEDVYGISVKARHSHCVHRGDKECTFEVNYSSGRYWRDFFLWKIGLIGLALGSFFTISNYAKNSFSNHELVSGLATVIIMLAIFLYLMGLKTYRVIKYHVLNEEQNRSQTETIFDNRKKLDRRYRESQLLSDLSKNLVKVKDPNEVVRLCLDALEKEFHYHKLFVMLLSADQTKLITAETRGLGEFSETVGGLSLEYPDPRPKQFILTKILENSQTILIQDMNVFKSELRDENRRLVDILSVNSLIASPIQSNDEKYGLLVAGHTGSEDRLTEEDKNLIQNITSLLSLYFINARQFERERSLRVLFQKYVPAIVLDEFGGGNYNLSSHLPRKREICSMFTDLRGFTKLSEGRDPGKVLDLINIYAEFVMKYIEEEGGVVDNLIGDGVVSFFMKENGSREKDDHHVQRGLKAALSIIKHAEDLRHKFAQKGIDFNGVGIGLHAGTAIVGTIGCEQKVNYTAVGDVVNLASRLQEYTKIYFNQQNKGSGVVVFSEQSHNNKIAGYLANDIGDIQVRGRKNVVKAYKIETSDFDLDSGEKSAA